MTTKKPDDKPDGQAAEDTAAEIPYPGLKGTEHDPEVKAAAEADARDVELAQLRAELEALRNPPPAPEPEPEDPRDRAIAQLRAELAEIRARPGGAESELAKAFAALQAQVSAMQAGQGLVPLPEPGRPDPLLYFAVLANGDIIEVPHPNATHHHVDGLGAVPIKNVWLKSPEALAATNVAA